MQNTFAKLVVRKGSASASSALGRRTMSSKLLVVAEHDQKEISAGSLSTITAALKIGGKVNHHQSHSTPNHPIQTPLTFTAE